MPAALLCSILLGFFIHRQLFSRLALNVTRLVQTDKRIFGCHKVSVFLLRLYCVPWKVFFDFSPRLASTRRSQGAEWRSQVFLLTFFMFIQRKRLQMFLCCLCAFVSPHKLINILCLSVSLSPARREDKEDNNIKNYCLTFMCHLANNSFGASSSFFFLGDTLRERKKLFYCFTFLSALMSFYCQSFAT